MFTFQGLGMHGEEHSTAPMPESKPGGQRLHCDSDTSLTESPYVFWGQGVAAAALAGQKLPRGHGVGAEDPDGQKKPSSHGVSVVEPGLGQYWPGEQDVHPTDVGDLLYVPERQRVHCDWPEEPL